VGICKSGAPSHDTYERFFKHLDPEAFEASFMKWAQSLSQSFGGVIAIDGKTLCNSGTCKTDPIHIVSAFTTENRQSNYFSVNSISILFSPSSLFVTFLT
jgi:hypothetical protein